MKQLRAVKVKASINRPAKPHILNRKISIFLLIWSFNNNNNIPKKKKKRESEIHQVPARELGFCGVCVYGGGRDRVFKQERRGLGWKDFSAAWFLRKEGEY